MGGLDANPNNDFVVVDTGTGEGAVVLDSTLLLLRLPLRSPTSAGAETAVSAESFLSFSTSDSMTGAAVTLATAGVGVGVIDPKARVEPLTLESVFGVGNDDDVPKLNPSDGFTAEVEEEVVSLVLAAAEPKIDNEAGL